MDKSERLNLVLNAAVMDGTYGSETRAAVLSEVDADLWVEARKAFAVPEIRPLEDLNASLRTQLAETEASLPDVVGLPEIAGVPWRFGLRRTVATMVIAATLSLLAYVRTDEWISLTIATFGCAGLSILGPWQLSQWPVSVLHWIHGLRREQARVFRMSKLRQQIEKSQYDIGRGRQSLASASRWVGDQALVFATCYENTRCRAEQAARIVRRTNAATHGIGRFTKEAQDETPAA